MPSTSDGVRLDVGDPRQLLHGQLLGLGHQRRPLVRVRRAARLLQRRGDRRGVEVVPVSRPARHERGQQRGRIGVVAVVHRREAVDPRPELGGDEEVDVVLGRNRLQRDLQPDRLGRGLIGGRHPGDHGQLAGGAEGDRLPGVPGLLDQLPGRGDVLGQHRRAGVGPGEHRPAVAERARVGHPPRQLCRALVDRVDDALPVQRHGQRPAHVQVTQHALEAGDLEHVARPARAQVHPDGAAALELVQGGQPHPVGPLDSPGQQARGQGRDVVDALEGDLAGQRVDRGIPVVRVADRDHAHPRCPRVEHVRAGAHDRPGRGAVVLALFLGEALLDDDPRHRGEFSFQPVVGLRQLDRYLGRAGRRDRGDPVQPARVVPAELGAGRAVQAVHHVGGGHRVAVPEFHPRPQREHQRGGRRVRDGGQAGLQRAVGRLAQQRLTHQGVGRVFRIAR